MISVAIFDYGEEMFMKWFKESFSAKMVSIILTLYLVFCGISTICWYQNFTNEAVNTAERNFSGLISALNENFEKSVRDVDYIVALVSNKVPTSQNTSVIEYLTVDETNSKEMVDSLQKAKDYLISRCSFKAHLNGLAVYNFNGRTCSYGITTAYSKLVTEPWFQEIKDGKKDVIYISPHNYTDMDSSEMERQVFSIVRPVFYQDEIIGIVKADIKCSLLEIMFDIKSMKEYQLYIVDRNANDLIYSSNVAEEEFVYELNEGVDDNKGSFYKKIGGISYLSIYLTSSVTPWTIIGVVEQKEIISGFIEVRKQMLWMVGVCVALLILSLLFAIKLVTRDLRNLSAAVLQVGKNSLQLNIKVKSSDEIGTLYQQICLMLERIRTMIIEIRQKEEEKRIAEMEMLSLQINPHFLYNTLHTIKILSIMQGVNNIEKVTNALSRMLHLNLEPRKFITIQEERKYLQDYLNIQEYRYAEKFRYQIVIDKEVEAYMIPKLLIQPIVENALRHGIALSENMGVVQVKIFRENESIKVVIKNSGKEFDKRLLMGTRYCGEESKHIGLNNINRRLRLLFGNENELKIFSESGLFTIIEMSIPVISADNIEKYERDS